MAWAAARRRRRRHPRREENRGDDRRGDEEDVGEDQRRMRRMSFQSCAHSTQPVLTASCGRRSPVRAVIQGRAAGQVPKARIAEAAATGQPAIDFAPRASGTMASRDRVQYYCTWHDVRTTRRELCTAQGGRGSWRQQRHATSNSESASEPGPSPLRGRGRSRRTSRRRIPCHDATW